MFYEWERRIGSQIEQKENMMENSRNHVHMCHQNLYLSISSIHISPHKENFLNHQPEETRIKMNTIDEDGKIPVMMMLRRAWLDREIELITNYTQHIWWMN